MADIDRVAELVAEADAAAEQARELIARSLDLLRRALAEMPDGTRLRFIGSEPYAMRKVDGEWVHRDDGPMEQDWVETYWLRRDLIVLREEANPPTTPDPPPVRSRLLPERPAARFPAVRDGDLRDGRACHEESAPSTTPTRPPAWSRPRSASGTGWSGPTRTGRKDVPDELKP